jgi:hypothetical protein
MKKIIFLAIFLCFLVSLVSLGTIKLSYWRIVETQGYFDAPVELSLEVSDLLDLQKTSSSQGKALLTDYGVERKLTDAAFRYCYWEERSFPRWFVYDFLRVKGEIEEKKIAKLLKIAARYRELHPITDDYFTPNNWNPNGGVSLEGHLQDLGDYPEFLKNCWKKIEKDAEKISSDDGQNCNDLSDKK